MTDLEQEKDYQGRMEECQACSNNSSHPDCYYALTGIPGKCENFYMDGFNVLSFLPSFN